MNEKEAFCNISFNSMLPLDMLAEVASETLRSDLTLSLQSDFGNKNSRNGVNKNSSQKRSATNTEVLNLDQIRVLSDKMLLEMFSEPSADEIRRVFKYQCYLMPDNCDEIFSSFGNEAKARLQMKSHLLTHIAKLLAEANSPEIQCKSQFFAEPLSARKKRLQETSPKRRKKIKNVPKKNKPVNQKKVIDKKTVSHKNSKTTERNKFSKNVSNQAIAANVFVAKARTRLKKSSHLKSATSKEKENSYREFSPSLQELYLAIQKAGNSNTDVQDDINIINSCVAAHEELKSRSSKSEIWNSVLNDSFANNITNLDSSVYLELPPTEKNSVKHESTSLQDNAHHFQHDHTYTSVNGKTFVTDTSETGKASKEKRKIPHRCSGVAQQFIIPTEPFPYLYDPSLPHICEIRELGAGTKKSCENCDADDETIGCQVKKSYGNFSQSSANKSVRYRRVNKLIIPEELEPDTEDDENVPVSFIANFVDDRLHVPEVVLDDSLTNQELSVSMLADNNVPENPSIGERKLALKCIRALRMKKKDERGPLVCQICNGKSFTAQATLMYHYRSHAGIKPFACSVCKATFTRQHSLNYHMLIHNNKSRFVCDECGRSFRHPSHYKEHLRRHTGETPFHCTDCNLRFKTRNTYKRHLKTRHGKILTARGIRVLSDEEFNKVRTMPRRRTSKQSLSNPIQKAQWSDLTFSTIPELKSELSEN